MKLWLQAEDKVKDKQRQGECQSPYPLPARAKSINPRSTSLISPDRAVRQSAMAASATRPLPDGERGKVGELNAKGRKVRNSN
ncbi:MAG TPA: hypothetical protein VEK32_07100 [Thermodesulfobacteriota bacterium]|nr:hypothetical protein [Thermodesulfobacteriota bacterium]